MLISCPECKRDVSDQASSCPHCGHPIKGPSDATGADNTTSQGSATPAPSAADNSNRKSPILVVLAAIALVMTLMAPRFLVFFPLMITLGLAVASLFRKESGKAWAILVLIAAVSLFFLSNIDPATIRAAAPKHALTYKIEGSAKVVRLTYNNSQGGTEQLTAKLPWNSGDMNTKEGDFLYISAQNLDEYGDVVVRILVDGQEIKHSSSYGSYAIASASGTCCRKD